MGYRGDDASRPWADDPYPSQDGYGVYEQGPRPDGRGDQHNYAGGPSQPGRYDGPAQPGGPGRHGRPPGLGGPDSYGGGYGPPGGHGGPGGPGGPVPGGPGGPGGYDRPAGGFPDNDWYGDSRSGGFADTSVNARPSIPGGYRPGDYDARSGAPGPAPEASRPGPRDMSSPPAAGPSDPGFGYETPYSGYENETSYPGYENVDDDQPGIGGYQGQGGYEDYDDYADFAPGGMPAQARPARSGPPPTTANPVYKGPPPTMANPVPKEFLARPASLLNTVASSPKKVMILVGSAVCLIGALAAIFFFLIRPSDEQAQANSPISSSSGSAANAACQKKFGEYCHITSRSSDPTPLSVSELYPPAVLNEKDHISFQRIATGTDKTCSNAVLGNSLQSAVGGKECSQAVRASYTSGSGSSEIVGTIGVLNLSTTNQAHNAGKLVGTNNLIKPLATNSGTGSVLGQSTGVMESQFKGHYLILTWAELASEATPTKSDDQKLQKFENDLIASTANISLSQRMVNGKPS